MSATTADVGAKRRALLVQLTLMGAMAIWGLNLAAVKELTASFDSAWLAALRMVVAAAALTAIVIWRRGIVTTPSLRQLCGLVLCGVLMVYLNQLLFVEGLARSTATNGALIMALSPLVSALLAALLFRERMSATRLCGVALGLSGVAAVILSHPGAGLSRAGTGDLMLVAAVVSFATGGAMVQRLSRGLDPVMISWAIHLVGAAILLAQALWLSGVPTSTVLFPGWWPWVLVLFSGVMATAVASVLWNRAISTIGLARTAVFLYWVPIFGVIFAALLLGEALTLWHVVGFFAVVGGTFLGTRRVTSASSS